MRLFRLLLAIFAGAFLTTAASTQPRDWRTNVTQLPSGAFVIGHPGAKVRLVEYLSYTCPHCAHFVEESKAPLHDNLVRRGLVRVEFRHAIRDPLDMTAALLARCAGAQGFVGASEAIFAAQADWYPRGAEWWQTKAAALKPKGELAQLRGVATASGLTQLMQGRGMSAARINQCFATATDLNKLTAMTKAAWAVIKGTPSFTVNGKAGGGSEWATLEPELRAAGAQ